MASGVCGEEWWIADELWRMAHSVPKQEFVLTVARMMFIGQKQPKRKAARPTREDTPHE